MVTNIDNCQINWFYESGRSVPLTIRYKSSAVAEMGDRGHNRHARKEGGGAAVPLSRTAGTPSTTMWPVPRSTSVTTWRLHPSSRLATIDGPKIGRVGVPFSGGSWVPVEHKVAWAEAYLHTKWHLSPSSRLATMDMGRKLGKGAPPTFWGGELGFYLTQSSLGEAYLRTKWHLDPCSRLAAIDMSRKLGAPPPFWEGVYGSPLNTKSPGMRPTSIPSGILMYPAVYRPL